LKLSPFCQEAAQVWYLYCYSAIKDIIQYYTREAGVRGLERCISKICRKTAKHIVSNEPGSVRVTAKNLSEYLGKKIYRMDEVNKKTRLE